MSTTATGTQTLQMLPNESKTLAMEFASTLVTGDSLSGTPTLSVTNAKTAAAPGAELTVSSATISGTQIKFQATTTSAVPTALYQFDVRCNTALSNKVQGIRLLEIIAQG